MRERDAIYQVNPSHMASSVGSGDPADAKVGPNHCDASQTRRVPDSGYITDDISEESKAH